MKREFRLSFVAVLLLAVAQSVFSQSRFQQPSLYIERADQPDGGVFLPAPPDTSSVAYIDDFVQWQWGKSVRPTARGERASDESASSTTEMARIYSEALGLG